MTTHKSFKRLVRVRMEKTGESYTAARAVLLAAAVPPIPDQPQPVLVASDAEIRRRSGRGWEQWFDLLDEWGAHELTHREISRKVAAELGIGPLVWEAQAVTTSYERARGLRAVGQHADGWFGITVTRTVAVPVEALFDAFADRTRRAAWLPDGPLTERTATRPRSARFDWGDGATRITATFSSKDTGKSTVVVEHARLTDATQADQMKTLWRERLTALKTMLEGERAPVTG